MSIKPINENYLHIIMKAGLKKFFRGLGLLISLFFASGLEPWALDLGTEKRQGEADDIDLLLDMAQLYEEAIEPSQDN